MDQSGMRHTLKPYSAFYFPAISDKADTTSCLIELLLFVLCAFGIQLIFTAQCRAMIPA